MAAAGGPAESAAAAAVGRLDLHDPGRRQADDPDRLRHPRPGRRRGRRRPAASGAASGGGISNLRLTRDGRTLYFQEGDSVYSTPVGGGGGGGGVGRRDGRRGWRRRRGSGGIRRPGAAGGGGGRGGGSPSTSPSEIDKPKEWDEMFDDAWRTMKYRFYDPKMHGKDWDAMRAKYKPLVAVRRPTARS